MRTTITIDDALYAEAKVQPALQAWFQRGQALAAADLPDLPVHGGGVLRPGVDPPPPST